MVDKLRVVSRYLILAVLFFLPGEQKKRLERWLRGREEFKRLQRADWVLVSWGKSGRTWLRVMLSRFYQLRFGLAETELLDFDNLHQRNPQAPKVFITHDNYLRDYTGNRNSKTDFDKRKIVLLVRDPRDVAVSQFFQWQFRMRPHKKFLNDYPQHQAEISPYEFVMNETVGLPRIIAYLNGWVDALQQRDDILLVRYEDMRASPATELQRIVDFTGTPGSEQEINEAVQFAAFDNMKKLEQDRFFKNGGTRVKPGDSSNPQSFKVRRAKVGGYQDYFDDEQCLRLEELMAGLDPIFGYTAAEQKPEARLSSNVS